MWKRAGLGVPCYDRRMPDSVSTDGDVATTTAWFVYVLRCKDGTLYTGIATDVERRLAEHRGPGGRGAKYLRGRQPLELVMSRSVGARKIALRVEHRIKRLARAEKEALLRDEARVERMVAGVTELTQDSS